MEITTLEWTPSLVVRIHGAGDGIRTRDIDLGKVALYQLSYSRSIRELHSRTNKGRPAILPQLGASAAIWRYLARFMPFIILSELRHVMLDYSFSS